MHTDDPTNGADGPGPASSRDHQAPAGPTESSASPVTVAWPLPFVPDETPPDEPPPDEPPPLELWRAVGDLTPWGTMLLLLGWGVVFALTTARQELDDSAWLVARGANVPSAGVLESAWRSLASTFLHGSASHAFFNAVTLLVLGQAAERIFAPGGFALIAVLGGACASFGSLAWRVHVAPDSPGLSIGGSGLVFALGGALLVVAVRLRRRLAVGRARAFFAVILLLTMPGLSAGFQRFGTDNAAHATGLVAGFVLGAVLPLRPALGGAPRSRATALLGALAGVALLVTFALVVRGHGVARP